MVLENALCLSIFFLIKVGTLQARKQDSFSSNACLLSWALVKLDIQNTSLSLTLGPTPSHITRQGHQLSCCIVPMIYTHTSRHTLSLSLQASTQPVLSSGELAFHNNHNKSPCLNIWIRHPFKTGSLLTAPQMKVEKKKKNQNSQSAFMTRRMTLIRLQTVHPTEHLKNTRCTACQQYSLSCNLNLYKVKVQNVLCCSVLWQR